MAIGARCSGGILAMQPESSRFKSDLATVWLPLEIVHPLLLRIYKSSFCE